MKIADLPPAVAARLADFSPEAIEAFLAAAEMLAASCCPACGGVGFKTTRHRDRDCPEREMVYRYCRAGCGWKDKRVVRLANSGSESEA